MPCLRILMVWATSSRVTAAGEVDRPSVLKEDLPKLNTVYRVAARRPLGPETALAQTYYRLLNRYVRYVRPNLRDWPTEPGAKFHKRDGSEELDIRQNAAVAAALAVLSEYGSFDETLAGASREQVRADALALIRYFAVTHVANFRPTGDGKPWGDHWQSAHWTWFVGQAAWLLWERLPVDTRLMVARLVAHEADRFNTQPPDDGRWGDTKTEENGWNSGAPALACSLFPHHPHAPLWRERTIVYMINAFTVSAGQTNAAWVDGKPVKDRVTTVCLHDDFTLENHRRVHPDYFSTFTLNLRNAILFMLGGHEIPQASFHHAADAYRVLAHLTAPNGSLFYVNGQDWWPHRHDVPLMVGGFVGVLIGDRSAAFLECSALAWLQRMLARFDNGRAFDPREFNYPNLEEEMMARYAELYLLHRLAGEGPRPLSRRAFERAQAGVRVFDTGGFVTHRNAEKFASFAWVNGAMGLVYPRANTWFTSPHERALVGRLTVAGPTDTPPQLKTKNVFPLSSGQRGTPDGFAFVGRFARCAGKVEQWLAMVSLPGEPVVYLEELRARDTVDVREVATGLLAVLNEDAQPITRNERVVWIAAPRACTVRWMSRPNCMFGKRPGQTLTTGWQWRSGVAAAWRITKRMRMRRRGCNRSWWRITRQTSANGGRENASRGWRWGCCPTRATAGD